MELPLYSNFLLPLYLHIWIDGPGVIGDVGLGDPDMDLLAGQEVSLFLALLLTIHIVHLTERDPLHSHYNTGEEQIISNLGLLVIQTVGT